MNHCGSRRFTPPQRELSPELQSSTAAGGGLDGVGPAAGELVGKTAVQARLEGEGRQERIDRDTANKTIGRRRCCWPAAGRPGGWCAFRAQRLSRPKPRCISNQPTCFFAL
mgnify:CR=1 FL=1